MKLALLVCQVAFAGCLFADTQLSGLARTKELAAQGDSKAIAELAAYHSNRGEYQEAYRLYLPFAQDGDDKVQFTLGKWLIEGQYRPVAVTLAGDLKAVSPTNRIAQNKADGIKWLLQSAAQGNGDALKLLGECQVKGNGLERDPIEAYKWFVLAVEHGNFLARQNREALAETLSVEQAKEGQRRADVFQLKSPLSTAPTSRGTARIKLDALAGSSAEPVAMINGVRFTAGRTRTVDTEGRPVEVTCLTIDRDHATVCLPPSTNAVRLDILPSTALAPKKR